MQHFQNGRLIEAETLAISITKEFPLHQFAWKILGAVFKKTGRGSESILIMRKSVQLSPQDAEAHNNLGVALQELGRLKEAEVSYSNAINLEPNYIEAHCNLGNTFKDQGKLDKAIISYDKAILINSDYAEAYYNKGLALKLLGKIEEAGENYTKAIELNADYAEAYNNLGNVFFEKGKTNEAIEAFKKSILINSDYADAHLNLSFVYLNSEMLQEGLNEYEWRWKTNKFLSQQRQFSQPLWDGKESLTEKRILLWSEQGIGDTIMWTSRLPLIMSQAKHCILECQEKLIPLLEKSFPDIEIKPNNINNDKKRKDFDFHLPMGSLYGHFIKEILQNRKVEAFLVPDPKRVKYWRKRLESIGNGLYIGVCWKSSGASSQRIQNYSSINDWSPIFKIPNVIFINLQYQNFEEDLKKIKNDFDVTVHNFNDLDHFNDILDVAALSAALDIVVSNKTTTPLISAGVGTLTKLANWKQSSWNNILLNPPGPSIDIFERNTWETWENVFQLIAEDILKLTKNWSN